MKEETYNCSEYHKKEQRKPNASWYHTVFQKRKHGFDPLVRNPAFAQGESAVYTELSLLKRHFHPTVALFASQILEGNLLYALLYHFYKKKSILPKWISVIVW